MTPARREELRTLARAHAFDAAFAETPVVVALGRAWTEARSRREGRFIVGAFLHVYPHYARRSARALVRLTLREVRESYE